MEKQFLSICLFFCISVTLGLGDPQICKVRTRILNERDVFEPRPCFFCKCRNSTLSCKDYDAAYCPEPPCEPEIQISTPDRCCKICPGVGARCRFNGMTVEDGENFQLTTRGYCECHNGRLTCVDQHATSPQTH